MALSFSLSEKTLDKIASSTGISIADLNKKSATEIDMLLEAKNKRKFKLDLSSDSRFIAGRGSVYLTLSRFLKFDVNQKINKI